MRGFYAPRGGFTLMKTPSHRQQVSRRRLMVVCTVLAMAMVSGLIGSMTHPHAPVSAAPATGPFSYFPSE
ncbi:hypothetical protein DJ021_08265 [Phenylobacterium hankyongense]|uniref:Uncharacterized protein n=1 Tax=Phenylobacterium hankyongense TaxID=1813876 RepID=A0A328AYY0_9CAUL|nr:hypothetical protein [Phenylobacterium hankyongense]RAK59797.1 hypothetical protein DJ021_08265 [Phenylobacterium hankyongense]